MALTIGELVGYVSMDTSGVDEGLAQGEKSMGKFKAAAAAAAAGAGVAFMAALNEAMEQEQVVDRLSAQLSATPEEAAKYGKIAGHMYANAVTEDVQGAADAIRATMSSGLLPTNATTAQIEAISTQVSDLANTFELDLGQSANAVGQLMKNKLAPDAQTALDVMTRGMQVMGPRADDLADTFNEYSPIFAKMGLSAQQATGLLSQGMKAGARDTDTVADAIKEFSIRAIDGSKASSEAYKTLGLDAEAMTAQIAKGGKGASDGMQLVLDKLRGMKDPVKQDAAAVGLFGTKAEDMKATLMSLNPDTAVAALGKVAGASENVGNTLRDSAGVKIEQFKRKIQETFVHAVGGFAIPKIQALIDKVQAFKNSPEFEVMKTAVMNIGTALMNVGRAIMDVVTGLAPLGGMILGAATAAASFVNSIPPGWLTGIAAGLAAIVLAVKAYQTYVLIAAAVTRGWAIAQGLLNVVMMLNPVGLVVAAIIALVAIIVIAWNKSETFRDVVKGVWEAIKTGIKAAVDFLVGVFQWFADLGSKIGQWFTDAKDRAIMKMAEMVIWLQGLPGRVMASIASLAVSLVTSAQQWWQSFKDRSIAMAVALVTWLVGLPGRIINSIKSLATSLASSAARWWQSFKDKSVQLALALVSWLAGLPGRIISSISSLASSLASSASRAWSSFKDAAIRKAAELIVYVRGLPGKITSGIGNLGSLLLEKGRNVVQGLWNGISGMGGWIKDKIMGWARSVIPGPIAKALGIASPSKVTKAQGQWIARGLLEGLLGSTKQIKAASLKISDIIADALSGKKNKTKRNNLLAMVNKQTKALTTLANREVAVANKLKAANANLANLTKARADLVAEVRKGVLEAGDITKIQPGNNGKLQVFDIVTQMQAAVVKAQNFARNLAALKKKGLRADLIAQIAQAGVEGGSAAAEALAQATPDSIKQVNNLQGQLVTAANNAGNVAGDAMYKTGIDAAKGLVKGLQKEQKSIEAQMLKIAKGMTAAIKKALGIKSPSRVFADEVGRMVPRGALVGIEKELPALNRAVSGMIVPPTGLGVRAGASSPVSSTTATPVVRVVVDPAAASGDDLLKWLRKTIRIEAGGNVQVALGKS